MDTLFGFVGAALMFALMFGISMALIGFFLVLVERVFGANEEQENPSLH